MIRIMTAPLRNGFIAGGDIVVADSDEADRAIAILSSEPRRPSELAEMLEEGCPGFEVVAWDSDDAIQIYGDSHMSGTMPVQAHRPALVL